MSDKSELWEIQNGNPDLDHDMRCCYELTEGASLCDCGAVDREWKRLKPDQVGEPGR